MVIVLISLLGLSCINAEDVNATEIALDQENDADLEVIDDSNQTEEEPVEEDILTSAPESDADSQSYLILDNDADKENIHVGDHVKWIISVINKGPDTAKNVKVNDQLPDGLKYINHSTTKGVFNPKTGIWDIGDLTVDDGEVFLYITTKALSVGEKINKATLTTDSNNLNENESYEEEEIDVFEDESDDSDDESEPFTVKAMTSLHSTGNPISIILLSLFAVFITSIKRD